MEIKLIEEAKQIFDEYRGNYYQMKRDGKYEEYKKFNISKDLENKWLKEIQLKGLENLKNATNKKQIADEFASYGDIVSQTKDRSSIKFMLDYFKKNSDNFDSYTLLRNSNVILNTVKMLADNRVESSVQREVVKLLKYELQKPIKISDDYKENGIFPNYISADKVTSNMKRLVRQQKVCG